MIPTFYPSHFLEGSTVTVTGENPDFPATNLADRDVVTLYKDSAVAGTRAITAHWAGASPPPVQDWIVPADHGLNAVALSLESSATGLAGSWTVRDTVTPASTATLLRHLASPVTAAWWRLTLTGALSAPWLAELYLTQAMPLPRSVAYGGRDGVESEVVRRVTPGGTVRKAKQYGPRWVGEYTIRAISETDWPALQTALYTVLEARVCYAYDVFGNLRYVELVEPAWIGQLTPIRNRDLTLRLRAVA